MAWIITGAKKLKTLFNKFCDFITLAAKEQPKVVGVIILAVALYLAINHIVH